MCRHGCIAYVLYNVFDNYNFVEDEDRVFLKPRKVVSIDVNTTTWTAGSLLRRFSVFFK